MALSISRLFLVAALVVAGCTARTAAMPPGLPDIDPDEIHVPGFEARFCDGIGDPETGYFYGFLGCCGSFRKAKGLAPGALVKAGGEPAVYYYASDGKLYKFPVSAFLESWAAPLDEKGEPVSDAAGKAVCGRVFQIPGEVMRFIPQGGFVPMRPGTYLTGPLERAGDYARTRDVLDLDRAALHVVDRGAALRKLASASLAEEIYPKDYAFRVRLFPKMLLDGARFRHGDAVEHPWDFDPREALTATIESELGLAARAGSEVSPLF